MPVRNRTTRLLPDNVLGSVLRETAREARRSKRRTGVTPGTAHGSTVVTTNSSGSASWTFDAPVPADAVPVVVATPRCSSAAIATITEVSQTRVTVTVFTVTGAPVAGVPVHLVAFTAPRPGQQ